MIEKEILRIINELNTYSPEGDEHNGKYIHKAWAAELNHVCGQLLTERNECVEEIKKLQKALIRIRDEEQTITHLPQPNMMVNPKLPKFAFSYKIIASEALSTTDSIKKLIEEVK